MCDLALQDLTRSTRWRGWLAAGQSATVGVRHNRAALPLSAIHPFVECPGQRHVPQHRPQLLGREARIPRPMRLVIVAKHTNRGYTGTGVANAGTGKPTGQAPGCAN